MRVRLEPLGVLGAGLVVAGLLGAGLAAPAAQAHDAGAQLVVSSSPARTGAVPLDGARLSGTVHVVLLDDGADGAVTAVEFRVGATTGTPRQVERQAPYDLAGGSVTAANGWDTRGEPEGPLTVHARTTYADGHVTTTSAAVVVDNVPDPPAPAPVRIDAGGPGVTTGGTTWAADRGATGGKAYANPAVTDVAGTTDDALYRTERSATTDRGSFSYAVPAPVAGTYVVRLHLAELYWGAPGGGPGGAGRRVFSVDAEGGPVELVDYDLGADVGPATAVVKQYAVPVTDGTLDLLFTARVDQPSVAAIEVLPPGSTVPPPPAGGDPTPFSWDTGTPAPLGRSEAQGAVVDGRLHVLGGFDVGTTTTARSDVLDTATGTWSRLPDMPVELTHSPAVVHGRTIWLVGGYVGDHPGPATRDVWAFDTVARTWSRGPSLPAPRGAGGAAVLGDQLHFFGGTDRVAGSTADPDKPDHWVLDLTGGTTWQRRAPMPNPRNHLAGAALGGAVYAIGGQHAHDETNGLQAQVDRYDPATDRWTRVADLPGARSHLVAVVRDGRVLAVGGTDPGNVASRAVTSYDPASGSWVRLPALPAGRKTPVAGVVGDVVHVTTGSHATTTWAGRFADRWESGPAMPVALGEVAGGVVGSTLYLVGEGSSATLALDLAQGTWRRDLPVRPYVGHHHAAEVVGGRLYLVGGLGAGAGKVQVYDPATRTWSLGADMPFAAGSVSTAVVGGRIYAAGGIVGSSTTTRAAVYDPATRTWSALPDMPQGRNHAAAGSDGTRFWVFGGRGPGSGDGNTVANGFDTVQVYDPATRTWRSSATAGSGLAPLPQARGGTGRAVLVDGRLVVLGGETATGAGATDRRVYRRVDVYDPATGRWSAGTPLPTARHGVFPVELGGRVVVAGGGVQAGASASAVVETYTPGW